MLRIKLLLVMLLLTMAACVDPVSSSIQRDNESGYIPIYGSDELRKVFFLNPREIKSPGRIYLYGKYLLINENNEGIHVFDNADPGNPKPMGFINILGNYDMAVKDNVLYAGHLGNITAVELNSFIDLEVKGTLTLDDWNYGIAPPAGFYFECVNPEKGPVIGWEKSISKNLGCYAVR
jgi:hypothetical protein